MLLKFLFFFFGSAAMVNATVAQVATQDWVLILIPTWAYYGMAVLFWASLMERPWRRYTTLRSFGAMFAAFAQHACAWLGMFYMARHWDRATGDKISWYILSIPWYLAIAFRCYCSMEAIAKLRHLQTKMVSRNRFEERKKAQDYTNSNNTNSDNNLSPALHLPDDFIVVTVDTKSVSTRLITAFASDPERVEEIRVQTSPEFLQVNQAALRLKSSMMKLVILGSAFITLVALKLEGHLDISFWLVFLPIWVHLGSRLFFYSSARTNNRSNNTNTIPANSNSSSNNNSPSKTSILDNEGEASTTSGDKDSKGEDDDITLFKSPVGENDGETGLEPEATDHPAEPAASMVVAIKDGMSQEQNNLNPLTDQATHEKSTGSQPVAAMDVEMGLSADAPTTENVIIPTPPPGISNSSSDDDEEEAPVVVAEEYERWQSVYENSDSNSIQIHLIPCRVLFHIMIVCLIVIKLDQDYRNNDPEDPGINAFLIILIPFSVALAVCCCAILAGCVELAHEELNGGRTEGDNAINTDPPGVEGDSSNALGTGTEVGADEELAPMQAGAKNPKRLTFSTHIDVPRPDLSLVQRIYVLTTVLPVSTTDAESWLVEFEDINARDKTSLWELIVACADGLDCHCVNYDDNDVSEDMASLDKEWFVLLKQNLQAHFEKAEFQKSLEEIRPLEDSDNKADIGVGTAGVQEESVREDEVSGIECPVCCEVYRIEDMVHCDGDPIHFFCRVCFHRYATETIESGGISGMPCADANCDSTFATPAVKANLSKWDILRMEERETERNTKVALAAKAVLNCTCGMVAIVTEEEIGDGCITCPGTDCGLQFCALCGNKWHPETSCPPTKKMLQWVVKNTMPCPNCHTPIEKNAGCDHMHCAPPGGCGHHFSYRTGKPMSKSGRSLRGLYH
jgi:hypothetical protein